jgi:aminopeptidase N
MKYALTLGFVFGIAVSCISQTYSRQDTLRGKITPERSWWDLTYYDLSIKVDLKERFISGTNTIYYKVLAENTTLQIDLQPLMNIYKVLQDNEELKFRRDGNVFFIQLTKKQVPNQVNKILIEYGGIPNVAKRPPWESGIVWEKDGSGNPFVSSISWAAGSSQWWPCKDHMYDEVDSLRFSINVPENLVAVANGRLTGVKNLKNKTKTYNWFVANPINAYGINFNIGNYVNFSEKFNGEKGSLDCSYYVLKQNYEKAKEQFKQVPLMLKAFEHWFGPYPFYEDSYKLVEVPYLGMEHQSATAYGNGYVNGSGNREDHSETGWGKKFDGLIIHESGHEWFACNITFKDIADIWIHESFTTYSEGLFVEYYYGKDAGYDYLVGLRKNILNDKPMIGNYDVNDVNYSGDNYPKGSTILHMLRQLINDDNKWRQILRGLNQEFYHQTVTTKQVEDYIAKHSGLNLNMFWDQYLRTKQIPVFEYYFADGRLSYRWTNSITGFDMPLKVKLNGSDKWIHPTNDWQKQTVPADKIDLVVDRNFYVPTIFSNSK